MAWISSAKSPYTASSGMWCPASAMMSCHRGSGNVSGSWSQPARSQRMVKMIASTVRRKRLRGAVGGLAAGRSSPSATLSSGLMTASFNAALCVVQPPVGTWCQFLVYKG